MKKLIVALAVVAMAVCAQAATYSWRCASLTDMKGGSFSGTVALINVDGVKGDSGTANAGNLAVQTIGGDAFTTGEYYKFYVTFTDDKGNTFTSVTKSSQAQAGASMPTLVFNMSNGNWQAAPEPTSAMLMLLGLAGLALKRRRA